MSNFKVFNDYRIPLLYSNKEVIGVDLINNRAFKFINADINRLTNFHKIIAYNRRSNTFLLGVDYSTDNPRLNISNGIDLLGLGYEEIDLSLKRDKYNWVYFILLIPISLPFILSKKRKSYETASLIREKMDKIRKEVSAEDFNILEQIVEAYPESIEFPVLQNSYEKDLSYESRIKKLRNTIKELDEIVRRQIHSNKSIFEVSKGLEDRRVKVIRIKDQLVPSVNLFRRLFPQKSK
jgi:hypothetical protein